MEDHNSKCPPHHWRIPTPSGEFSIGVCKKCGDTKKFTNWLRHLDNIYD